MQLYVKGLGSTAQHGFFYPEIYIRVSSFIRCGFDECAMRYFTGTLSSYFPVVIIPDACRRYPKYVSIR